MNISADLGCADYSFRPASAAGSLGPHTTIAVLTALPSTMVNLSTLPTRTRQLGDYFKSS